MRVGSTVRTVCPVYAARHKNQVESGSMVMLPKGSVGTVKSFHEGGSTAPFSLVRFDLPEGRFWGQFAHSMLEEIDADGSPVSLYESMAAQIAREIDQEILDLLLEEAEKSKGKLDP